MKIIISFLAMMLLSSLLLSQDRTLVVNAEPLENQGAIYSLATVDAMNPNSEVVGIIGQSQASNGTGVRGIANTGVRGIGAFGIIGDGSSRAGYFGGDLEYTGTLHGPSDRKLKTILKSDETFLERVMLLTPKKYKYKTDEFSAMRLPSITQYGFIAQELEKVFPNLVHESIVPANHDMDGKLISPKIEYKSVSMIDMIPILTKSLQELAQENQDYKTRVEQLENEVAEMKLMMSKVLEK